MTESYTTTEDEARPRHGALRVLKRLRAEKVEIVEHGLCTLPLVDVYQLDYFPVVSAADDQTLATWVNFYLHHTRDRSVHRPGAGDARLSLYGRDRPEAKLPLARVLAELGIEPGDDTHLADVVAELWKALFAPPSDPFDETAYADSPWLSACCGDRRSVGELKTRGDWDDLWLYFRPRKTLNSPRVGGLDPRVVKALAELRAGNTGAAQVTLMEAIARAERGGAGLGVPPQVEVTHVDYDTLTLRLLPPYEGLYDANEATGDLGVPADAPILRDELNVMLLLRA